MNPEKLIRCKRKSPPRGGTNNRLHRGRIDTSRKYGQVAELKTTLQVPDQLLRDAKASAASSGTSLKQFVCSALRSKLQADKNARSAEVGWRAVFGKARGSRVEQIDRLINAEFGSVDGESWK